MADRVVFLRPDAERIARVVRRVEGMRDTPPLTFRRVINEGRRNGIRLASYDGAWNSGSVKTVTFASSTATVEVYNSLMNLPAAGARQCIVGRDGTAWQLVNWQQDLRFAATAAELTTTRLTFKTSPVGGFAVTGTTFSVSVATCATTGG
jgi:hypothetical protein